MAGPTWGSVWNLSSSTLFDIYSFKITLAVTNHRRRASSWVHRQFRCSDCCRTVRRDRKRAFCAWVCPLNIVTDLAAWLRRKLNLKASYSWPRVCVIGWFRYCWLAAPFSGSALWVWIDPVSALHRGLIFGMGAGWMLIVLVFLLDLLLVEHGWCGHLCR